MRISFEGQIVGAVGFMFLFRCFIVSNESDTRYMFHVRYSSFISSLWTH